MVRRGQHRCRDLPKNRPCAIKGARSKVGRSFINTTGITSKIVIIKIVILSETKDLLCGQ
jgi:hypothetical protein